MESERRLRADQCAALDFKSLAAGAAGRDHRLALDAAERHALAGRHPEADPRRRWRLRDVGVDRFRDHERQLTLARDALEVADCTLGADNIAQGLGRAEYSRTRHARGRHTGAAGCEDAAGCEEGRNPSQNRGHGGLPLRPGMPEGKPNGPGPSSALAPFVGNARRLVQGFVTKTRIHARAAGRHGCR